MTRTQILLGAALVLAPLFSMLMRAVMRRLEGDRPRDRTPGAPNVPAPVRPPPVMAAGAGAGPRDTSGGKAARTALPSMVAKAPAPPRHARHREVRRGIVLMTILGPCRALEPPGA